MIFHETELEGAYLIELEKHEDSRGFFARSFCRKEFEKNGLNPKVMQANLSYSQSRGTLRGLHYQVQPHAEAKFVRCTSGSIYDVIVDLRPESSSYRQWLGIELLAKAHKMIYVPEGFAHGYLTLADHTEVMYQVSEFYAPNVEKGIRWNDPYFAIKWPETETLLISEKDQGWPDWLTL